MTSAFSPFTILKQSSMPEKQLSNFLFHLSQQALREYLFNAGIHKGRDKMSKNELVERIITGKPKTIEHFGREDELTKEDALNYLKNNMLTDFKKYLQFLSVTEQIYTINDMIDFISTANIDINKKFNMKKELKEMTHKLLLD